MKRHSYIVAVTIENLKRFSFMMASIFETKNTDKLLIST
ncbi:hypothetical protein B4083_0215 [Bacillus cereus]|nr:hypothetical protein B4083_0215 [Bacillus cereus]